MKKLLTVNQTLPIGFELIRMISGAIIFYFGLEVFEPQSMDGYTEWLTDVGMPFPGFMPYVGKLSELICGATLAIGLFTRLSAIPLIATMFVVNFIMLDGNILADTFYLLLLFSTFLFAGSGRISLDYVLSRRSSNSLQEAIG